MLREAGLPATAIPDMPSKMFRLDTAERYRQFGEAAEWALEQHGGNYDRLADHLLALVKAHKAGPAGKLYSLMNTLGSPDLMTPKPARETLEEYHARLEKLPG